MADLSSILEKIFPLTLSLLLPPQARVLGQEFLRDWGVESLHFFPMLVRQKNLPRQVIEVADYEYQRWSLLQDLGGARQLPGRLVLHPHLRTLPLLRSASFLCKEPGLYALWPWQGRVREMKLNGEQAALLQRLQEDLILSRQELNSREMEILDQLILLHLVAECPISRSAENS